MKIIMLGAPGAEKELMQRKFLRNMDPTYLNR